MEHELENQFDYNKQPNKTILKKAEKKVAEAKKSIDPKYIFDKSFKKKKGSPAYRKPKTGNDEKQNSLEDLMYSPV